jgi:uncharacterized MAPEG superfamily protein
MVHVSSLLDGGVMTIPIWVLLAFASWTLLVLIASVGVYRWTRILAGSVPIREFRHDKVAGHADWYRRAMRAHGNCVENLPVYGAIVLVLYLRGIDTPVIDGLALVFMGARVCQTVTHVAFVETNRTVSVRFTFFAVQAFIMLWMALAAILTDT